MSTILDLAIQYRKEGWYPVPVPHRTKGPTLTNWPELRLDTPEQLKQHFNGRPQNIGVLLGECSGNLVDTDLDQPECLPFAKWLLPPTRSFGRKTNIDSHWLYRSPTEQRRVQFFVMLPGADGKQREHMFVELRANRHQTVFPGSTHKESGEPITWTNQRPLTEIGFDELERKAGLIAAGAALAQAWPREKGSRHQCELALAGILLRVGLSDLDAQRFITTIATIAGTENADGRARNSVQTTRERLSADQPVTGWRTLSKLLNNPLLIGKVPAWLGYSTTFTDEPSATVHEDTEKAASEPDTKPSFVPPEHWKRLDVANIREWKCDPLRPIIGDILAHGNFAILAAQSQTGKTLLGLYLSRMLLQGGMLFSKYPVTPVSRVAYLLLEDPDRRAQERILDTEHEFQPLEPERFVIHAAPSFTLTDDRMFGWLEHIITTEKRDVVVLDTYQKSTPGIGSFDDEKQAVILHKLANLTRRLNVTIIVLDHFRKEGNGAGRGKGGRDVSIDDLKGTGGKAQNADCVILMQRTGDRKQVKFQVFSKDFDTPVRILLNVAPRGSTEPKFSYATDLEALGQSAGKRAEAVKKSILESMKPGQWLSAKAIATGAKMDHRKVLRHLNSMIGKEIDATGETHGRMYCRPLEDSTKNEEAL
jgi:hypothetical protein